MTNKKKINFYYNESKESLSVYNQTVEYDQEATSAEKARSKYCVLI